MSDTLKLALRISAVDLFSGVLRRFRNEIVGTGAEAQALQKRYDQMINHTQAGLKSLAVSAYLYDKMKPALEQAVDFQDSMLQVKGLLQNQYDTADKLNNVMGKISQNAKNVAGHMMYNAIAVMDVQRQLVQAGVPVSAILDRVDKQGKVHHGAAYQVEAFAEANGLDPATTALNVANVAHAFQLTPDQYGPMADTIEKAINLGSGDATQFFHNMENFGAIAHLGNTSVRDASIALKAIAPLGEQGGSDLGAAMSYAFGGSQRGSKHLQHYGLNFYDKQHKFIGLFPMIDKLHAFIESHHLNEEQRNKLLAQGFQQTGMKVLALLLEADKPGAKSFHAMDRDFNKQPSLAQMIATRESGAKMAGQEAMTTIQSMEATLFDPLLPQLRAASNLTNEWADAIGKFASKHPAFAKGVSYTAEAVTGAAAGYGIFRLIKAAKVGSPLLKRFLRGTGSVAEGVAEGKVIEKLTGVTPVFVTNWPGTTLPFGGGAGGPLAKDGEEAAAAARAESAAASAASTVAERAAAEHAAAAESAGATAATKVAERTAAARAESQGATAATTVAERTAAARAESQGATAATTVAERTAAEHAVASESSAVSQAAAIGEGVSEAGMGIRIASSLKWLKFLDGAAFVPIPEDDRLPANVRQMEQKAAHESWADRWRDLFKGKTWRDAFHHPDAASNANKLEGTIRIQIDQDGRAKVAQVKSNQPDLHLNVGTMLGTP